MKKRKAFPAVFAMLFLSGLFFLLARNAFAFQGVAGFHYTLPRGEKIASDLYLIGWNVDLEGEVDGNLFVLGGVVRVHGPVHGNVYLAGGQIEIDGPVEGDINIISLNAESESNCRAARILALDANQSGNTKNDLLALGVLVNGSGNVQGDTLAAGGDINLGGTHSGRFFCMAKKVDVSGTVDGFSNIQADSITLEPSAALLGNVEYTSPQIIHARRMQIKGDLVHHYPAPHVLGVFHFPWLYTLFHRILSAVWLTVVGLFAITTWAKKPIRPILDAMLAYPWESFGAGLLVCLGVPGIGIILIVSILGLPLGFILLGLFAIGVYITRLFASLYIGERLLQVFERHRPPYWQSLPIGVAVFTILTSIPFIGTILSLITIPLAFGGKLVAGRKFFREPAEIR